MMKQFAKLKVTSNTYQIKDGFCYYEFKIEDLETNSNWNIRHRYSTLRQLHNQMKKQYKGQLPNFPGKKFFGNMEKDFIMHRQKQLVNYMNLILTNIDKDKIPNFYSFLNNKEIQESYIKRVQKDDKITEKVMNKEGKEIQEFKQIKEEITNKLIDMTTNIQPPDDSEIRLKQKLYQNLQQKQFKVPLYLKQSLQISSNLQSQNLLELTFFQKNNKYFGEIDKIVNLIQNNILTQNAENLQNYKFVHSLIK